MRRWCKTIQVDHPRIARAIRVMTVFLLLPTTTLAAEWPKELMYNGQRIAPTCIDELVTSSTPDGAGVSLEECTAAMSQFEEDKSDATPPQQDFYGWRFHDKEFGNRYSFTKYLGRFRGGFVLYSIWSGGGTGKFTDISIVKRKGNTLLLHREVAAGDRCNGGVTEAWMERGKLFYKINLTPYDIVTAVDTATTLKASDDLQSTPTSCFATATFTHTNENQPVLQVVTLNQEYPSDMLSDSGWIRDFSYQTCFNKQFLDALTAGNISMDKKALSAWVQGFYEACVTQKTIDAKPVEAPAAAPILTAPPLDEKTDIPEIHTTPDDGVDQNLAPKPAEDNF